VNSGCNPSGCSLGCQIRHSERNKGLEDQNHMILPFKSKEDRKKATDKNRIITNGQVRL
jgi:hypothetical protein